MSKDLLDVEGMTPEDWAEQDAVEAEVLDDMTRVRVTAEMVERAARAIWMRDARQYHGALPWEELRDVQRIKDYRSRARAALVAALESKEGTR